MAQRTVTGMSGLVGLQPDADGVRIDERDGGRVLMTGGEECGGVDDVVSTEVDEKRERLQQTWTGGSRCRALGGRGRQKEMGELEERCRRKVGSDGWKKGIWGWLNHVGQAVA
jgi:hypothetical protein